MSDDKEELYRRLEQVRRHLGSANDAETQQRMNALANELQQQLAAAEGQDTDALPEAL